MCYIYKSDSISIHCCFQFFDAGKSKIWMLNYPPMNHRIDYSFGYIVPVLIILYLNCSEWISRLSLYTWHCFECISLDFTFGCFYSLIFLDSALCLLSGPSGSFIARRYCCPQIAECPPGWRRWRSECCWIYGRGIDQGAFPQVFRASRGWNQEDR